jgi:multidrug efflux system membrane fusion protein
VTARRAVLLLLLLAVGVLAISGCARESSGGSSGSRGPGGGGGAVFPVEVTPVGTRPVEYAVTAVGSIEAFEIVRVTARVAGAVERVHFREGDRVRQGETLVEIEPERYRLAVEEARAALEQAKASAAEAEGGLARRTSANEKTAGLIPTEEIDAWRTRVATASAEVASREASMQLAERNQRDALAQAPVSGTIQTRDIQTGTYVQPGALLTTLVRRDPLLLRFQVPEGEAARLPRDGTARFEVRDTDGEHTAKIVHVADSADPTTRMVAVTAEVVRPDASLRPGAFAEVVVPVGGSKDATVIPQTSVRPSERGFLAFVVEDDAARERILTLGLRTPEGLVEVKSGLAPGERLVVRGAEALTDGAKVKVSVPADSVGAPDSALARPRETT